MRKDVYEECGFGSVAVKLGRYAAGTHAEFSNENNKKKD